MIAKLSMICSKQFNGSYFAICPEIKGCFTQGDSYEEAVANIKELVEITVREELSREEISEMLFSESKIFSEFEIVV
ncbi:MAG: type II toxin-antitoxin system HicB family antitoxin [Defluviitaleaceae bacterium]|nr:type II toxin-antitoxin system HicB family antitoxin [Defluviitaleaceae bacterium]